MKKMIEMKLDSQQRVSFESLKKNSYSPASHYNDTKYHHSKSDKKRKTIVKDVVQEMDSKVLM